ncbi:uncharacterized protein [Temnothorax nylanderi]|uniref:uncharacterized protein isoform X2 n=1 Tax=Temnothorax nylanderi TaxID=102681 RepID=UPI003A8AC689
MEITRKSGKSRQGRATQRQIEALITYLEEHPHVASGKFTTMNSHAQLQGSWEDLATFLNSLVPKGKEKDVKSWKTTWRDLKSKISEKVQKLRKGRAATGNNPIDIILSEVDKRILGIIGHEYVQGITGVPDSFPEEHNASQMKMKANNTMKIQYRTGQAENVGMKENIIKIIMLPNRM